MPGANTPQHPIKAVNGYKKGSRHLKAEAADARRTPEQAPASPKWEGGRLQTGEYGGDTRRKQRQFHKPAATNAHPTPPSPHTTSPKAKACVRADRVDAKKGSRRLP